MRNIQGGALPGVAGTLRKYLATAVMATRAKTNGGVLYLLPDIAVRLFCLVPLMFFWRAVAESGADAGMTLAQMLTYTYINAVLSEQLVVQTFASSWCYEGELQKLYPRPMALFGDIIAETAGGWVPMLLFYSLPLALAAPLFGVSVLPASAWFVPSLLLCISLGFAVDFIFTCVAINLRGISWLAYAIRMAVSALFSGTVIPFRLLPFGLSRFFELQPFGSLGGAPLSIFVGVSDPVRVITVQLFWNVALWAVAAVWFARSRERMVSFGG